MPVYAVVLINAGLTFGGGFAAALAAGASWKLALGAGLAALTGNQIGLHQTAPTQKKWR